MRRLLRSSACLVVLLVAGSLFQPPGSNAQSQKFAHGSLTLVPDKSWIDPGQDFTLGLHFSLESGWHIYWINPGDSGEPPRVKWTLPAGLTAGSIEWPAPHKLGTPSIVDYGYQGDVTLLVPMQASTRLATNAPAMIHASLNLLICRDMCIPGKTEVAVSIPVKAQPAPMEQAAAALFASARAKLPQAPPAGWKFSVTEEKDSFVLLIAADQRMRGSYFFPLEESQIVNPAEEKIMPHGTGFELTLKKSDELTKPVSRLKGVLALPSGPAYLVDAPVTHGNAASGGLGH
ncbi:MAG TPA: protein-disulfide reductase DsbD domain-containing protein [Candidatus Acidoferrales bacterium]|nr:protein-disulfide reductase DsbD domain-containing protein [Candidatus Acidoferrales bacterium]